MIKEVKLKCFGRTDQVGSIAMVISGVIRSPEQKLKYAQSKLVPACVFVEKKHEYVNKIKKDLLLLDFYYDYGQSPLCIHATLAAGFNYFKENPEQQEVAVITFLGQRLSIIRRDGLFYVSLLPMPSPRLEISRDFIADLLKIQNKNLIKNHYIASVGSPKLCVEIDLLEDLNNLCPDLAKIMLWSKNNRINGLYVYVQNSSNVFVGRNFNHYVPEKEDHATGVAAGALTVYYQSDLTVYQGQHLKNPCVIYTQYISDNQILVGGNVTAI